MAKNSSKNRRPVSDKPVKFSAQSRKIVDAALEEAQAWGYMSDQGMPGAEFDECYRDYAAAVRKLELRIALLERELDASSDFFKDRGTFGK